MAWTLLPRPGLPASLLTFFLSLQTHPHLAVSLLLWDWCYLWDAQAFLVPTPALSLHLPTESTSIANGSKSPPGLCLPFSPTYKRSGPGSPVLPEPLPTPTSFIFPFSWCVAGLTLGTLSITTVTYSPAGSARSSPAVPLQMPGQVLLSPSLG